MSIITLDMPLKGKRNYNHGTSLFDFSLQALKSLGFEQFNNLDVTIQKKSYNILQMVDSNFDVSTVNQFENKVATIKFVAFDHKKYTFDVYDTSMKISGRVPYLEELIANNCSINTDTKEICLTKRVEQFTQIEHVVCMTKLMHHAIFKLDNNLSWVFTKITYPTFPINSFVICNLKIKFDCSLGKRLTRSTIFDGKIAVGSIYFSSSNV